MKTEEGPGVSIEFSSESNGFRFGPEPPKAEMSSREGQESNAVIA